MIFSPKNPGSSVIQDSETTVSMLCFTSLPYWSWVSVSIPLSACRAYASSISLRELDIELMKRLSPRVNVIPVIGKADSLPSGTGRIEEARHGGH
jgi:hypothetical protein